MSRNLWSPDDILWLKENWQLPDVQLCEHLNRAIGSIRTKRRELGLIGKENERKSDWSQSEIDYISEVWGEKTIPQIARHLGRSINAVKVKSVRLGYTGQKWYGEMMSARKVSELLGVDVHAVCDYWIPKCGLKGRRQKLGETGSCTIVKFSDLLSWLEANQDKWDSRRVELYSLGMEYDWLVTKRKADIQLPERRLQKWTPEEDSRLKAMFRKGNKTYAEIAAELGRPVSGVEHRLSRIDVWGTGHIKRDPEKLQKISLELHLVSVLRGRLNELSFGGFWQKDMCLKWHDIKGCTAGCTNCDECASFVRIKPQYCVRCGATFIEREENLRCPRCREQRKRQYMHKHLSMQGARAPVPGVRIGG